MTPVQMRTRTIPSSAEPLPVIGCGTYFGFDRAPGSAEFAQLPRVLGALFAAEGSVVDSSPMYGKAEAAVGHLLDEADTREEAFLATKVWTTGREAGLRQMEASLRLLRTDQLDLLQVHNLVDWRTHLAKLREWKAQERVRYVGISHYTASAYAEVEEVLRSEPLDFLQINYSVEESESAQRLLPLAAERGVAVLVNRPFGGGGLLRRLQGKPLPAWAAEIGCTSWPQVLLKFVLSQPAVTCAIPGSGSPEHMAQNALAGCGLIPEPGFWQDKLRDF
jgi:diketogulonate reductase-like aldo/keto reductase